MGKELIAALPIAGYWLDRRRRHKNKPEEIFNPKNFADNPLTIGRSSAGDTRGSAPLFSESRSTKEKKSRPVVHRFGLRKKGIVGAGLGVAGLATGSRLSSDSRKEKQERQVRQYPYYRFDLDETSGKIRGQSTEDIIREREKFLRSKGRSTGAKGPYADYWKNKGKTRGTTQSSRPTVRNKAMRGSIHMRAGALYLGIAGGTALYNYIQKKRAEKLRRSKKTQKRAL